MTHPLTDEMIDEIQIKFGGPCLEGYDDNMRAAADWQLEQVIKWLHSMNQYEYLYAYPVDPELDKDELIADLKKAMRPQ